MGMKKGRKSKLIESGWGEGEGHTQEVSEASSNRISR